MMRLLLFLLTTTVFSQNEFSLIENFLYVDNEIQVWSNDSIYRFNKNLQLVSIKKNPLVDSSYKSSSIRHVGNNSISYYLSNGSGSVYDSKLKRISDTNNSKFFNNSSSFIHNDTIYKFGGYGFWTTFKGLIYFDFNNGDWNYFNLKNPKSFDGLFNSEIVKNEPGKYLVYGGDKLNLKNSLLREPNKNIYLIDFEKSELKYIGKSSIDFSGRKINFENGTSLNLNKNSITILDWINNTLKKYKTNWTHKVSLDYRIFMINDVIFYIEKNNKGYVLSSSEIDTNNLKIIDEHEIFKTNSFVQYIIFTILFLIVFIFYYLFKDFNKIKVRKQSIRYRFVRFKIDEEKEQILSVISKDKKISTNQLFEIISSKDLHPNHIYRLIPEVMNDISKTIKLVTRKNEEVFSISKNEKDRRIKEYRLNPNYKTKN
jgi:hypothetical protein